MWNMTSDSVFLRKITLFLEKQVNTNIKLPISLGLSRIVFGVLLEGEYKKSFSHGILSIESNGIYVFILETVFILIY